MMFGKVSTSKKIQLQHKEAHDILQEVIFLTDQVRNEDLKRTVEELRLRIDEPYMFVIVGEVKAGKSSFVNALLGSKEDIAKVAPDPCTDKIQQLKYGDEVELREINDHYVQLFQPFDILREISIVDTPGTNTIIEHHQEITERFVPIADLIVFVFEAKNPYRQSSWEFFDYINSEWHKKVIFVLQQKDLVLPADLEVNVAGVAKYAKDRGIASPTIFSVSALREKEGLPDSGYEPLRSYIEANITSGQAPALKQLNTVAMLKNINDRIYRGLDERIMQYQKDSEFREDIRSDLDEQEQRSMQKVEGLLDGLLGGYDKVARHTRTELKEGLSFFILLSKSFKSMFNKDHSPQAWLDEVRENLETELNHAMRDQLNDGVSELADSIQAMAKIIELKLQYNTTILTDTHELYSHIAKKRKGVLQDVRDSFQRFMSNSDNFSGNSLYDSSKTIVPNIATGSGIAIVGVILAALTKGVVFDITGGVLTTIGLLFAGITAGLRRNKLLKNFDQEIAKGRENLGTQLTTTLTGYIQQIRDRIEKNFEEFDTMLSSEKEAIAQIEAKHAEVEIRIQKLTKDLSNHPA